MKFKSYQEKYYEDYVKVITKLGFLKIEPLLDWSYDKTVKAMIDSGYFYNDPGAILAIEDECVIGAMKLEYKGLKKKWALQIGIFSFIKKYGLLNIIRLLQLKNSIHLNLQKGELYIDSISVDPKYRGRGIGSSLITEAENFKEENGFEHLSLIVLDSNVGAKKLYEKLGFKVVKEIPLKPKYQKHYKSKAFFYMIRD